MSHYRVKSRQKRNYRIAAILIGVAVVLALV